MATRVSLSGVCLQQGLQVYLGVPKSVCYLPTAAASWCTEGLRLPHTMRMACPAVPEAACWVVSHKPEPRAVPGRSCKLAAVEQLAREHCNDSSRERPIGLSYGPGAATWGAEQKRRSMGLNPSGWAACRYTCQVLSPSTCPNVGHEVKNTLYVLRCLNEARCVPLQVLQSLRCKACDASMHLCPTHVACAIAKRLNEHSSGCSNLQCYRIAR